MCGSYGTYEDGFHDGIDIPGAGGATKGVAIGRIKVNNIWDGPPNQSHIVFGFINPSPDYS